MPAAFIDFDAVPNVGDFGQQEAAAASATENTKRPRGRPRSAAKTQAAKKAAARKAREAHLTALASTRAAVLRAADATAAMKRGKANALSNPLSQPKASGRLRHLWRIQRLQRLDLLTAFGATTVFAPTAHSEVGLANTNNKRPPFGYGDDVGRDNAFTEPTLLPPRNYCNVAAEPHKLHERRHMSSEEQQQREAGHEQQRQLVRRSFVVCSVTVDGWVSTFVALVNGRVVVVSCPLGCGARCFASSVRGRVGDRWRAACIADRMLCCVPDRCAKQVKSFVQAVCLHAKDFYRHRDQKRALQRRVCRDVAKTFSAVRKLKGKEEDRQERERLKLLRLNDMEAYQKLLHGARNERLQYVIHTHTKPIRWHIQTHVWHLRF